MSFSFMKKASRLLPILIAMSLPISAVSEESTTHIRTLASSCATCHGEEPSTQTVIPSLAGLDEDYFINKMKAYQSSDKEHEVMVQHAKGLTEVEIAQLAKLFSLQSRACHYYKQHPDEQSLIKQPLIKQPREQ
jgi:sulfide dehydrogenase cytochrome subunit